MKPVDQTTFGDGSDGTEPGNCFAACIASVLEVDIGDVPNFVAAPQWWVALQCWLRPRGLSPMRVPMGGITDVCHAESLSIAEGVGPRGLRHSVVADALGRTMHDPHPSRGGLMIVDAMVYLVPIDPVER